MIATFSLNMNIQQRDILRKTKKLVTNAYKYIEKDNKRVKDPLIWFTDGYLSIIEDKKDVDVTNFEMYVKVKEKTEQYELKRNTDIPLITPEEVEKGYVGLLESYMPMHDDSIDEMLTEIDFKWYITWFETVRRKIIIQDGVDLKQVLRASKLGFYEAQETLKYYLYLDEYKDELETILLEESYLKGVMT